MTEPCKNVPTMTKQLRNLENRQLRKERIFESSDARTTLSFYEYRSITYPEAFRNQLYEAFDALEVYGRIYVAHEGVNAQISLPTHQLERLRDALRTLDFEPDLRLNIAIEDDGKSFYKLDIRVRHKIVADGLQDDTFDPADNGVHLDAEGFNELAARTDAVIVDMRNHYESEVGHFEGAILPDADTFREALPMVEASLRGKEEQPIIMYCTGGIRCEKASAYFKHKGFKEVYQLDGGIIEYARQVEAKGLENKFKGKNFVFDERMGERISDEIIAKCHQCGTPCDAHTNCANDRCHLLLIQCPSCAEQYRGTCSQACADFVQLPVEERQRLGDTLTFNGSNAGTKRYRGLKNKVYQK